MSSTRNNWSPTKTILWYLLISGDCKIICTYVYKTCFLYCVLNAVPRKRWRTFFNKRAVFWWCVWNNNKMLLQSYTSGKRKYLWNKTRMRHPVYACLDFITQPHTKYYLRYYYLCLSRVQTTNLNVFCIVVTTNIEGTAMRAYRWGL